MCAGEPSGLFFFHWRVLTPAYQLPWTLVRGEVKENLGDLAAGPRPKNETAERVWELMHDGVPSSSVD